jgi:plastocyanin
MFKSIMMSVRRPVSKVVLSCLTILVCALAACGGTTSTPSSAPTSPPTQANTVVSAATITIREKTGSQDIYSFDPQSVTIKAGQAVTFDNQSDEFHQLITADAAGKPMADADPFTANTIVPTSRASATTTLQVVFKTPGTYYYTSKLVNRIKDNAHPEGALSQGMGTIIVS